MGQSTYRLSSLFMSATMLALVACQPAAAPSPTSAPAKPADKPTEAAKPAPPAASPAAAASPGASPVASPAAAASPAASPVASPAAAAAPSGAAAKPASGPPTKIGVLTPLSPPGDASAGQLIQRGAELAVPYVNQRMGSNWNASCNLPGPIELVIGDDRGTPEQGVAGFRKMVQDDKVAGVVGSFHSSVMLAESSIADQLKVPAMSTQASNSQISGQHNAFVFQTHLVDRDRATNVSTYLKEQKANFKKVAIVGENTDYGTGLTEEMKRLMADTPEIQMRDWIFDRTSADISPLLLQVKQFDPDLIFNAAVGAPTYLMIKQSYDVGLLPKALQLVSYDLPIRQEFWDNLGPQGNNILFVAYYHPQQAVSDAGKYIQAEYQKKYNETALYSSFQGFSNVVMMAQAINQACSTDGTAMVKALETGKFTNWNADNVNFPQAEGLDWHRVKIPVLILQYNQVNQPFDKATLLFPSNMKTGEVRKGQ